MWNIAIITIDQVAQDDMIRALLIDDVYPQYATVTTPNETTYTINATVENAARIRQEVCRNINLITMFVCDPI